MPPSHGRGELSAVERAWKTPMLPTSRSFGDPVGVQRRGVAGLVPHHHLAAAHSQGDLSVVSDA
jgi:hypothetical protein